MACIRKPTPIWFVGFTREQSSCSEAASPGHLSKQLNLTFLVVQWLTTPNQKDDVYGGNDRMDPHSPELSKTHMSCH